MRVFAYFDSTYLFTAFTAPCKPNADAVKVQKVNDVLMRMLRKSTRRRLESVMEWREARFRRRRDDRWHDDDRRLNIHTKEWNTHTVFVDNLIPEITRGDLYRMFGWQGEVRDVFISRKTRRGTSSPFAFVRYDLAGGAERAARKLNGTVMRGRRVSVTHARFGRDQKLQGVHRKNHQGWERRDETEHNNRETTGKAITIRDEDQNGM
ncbi:hypothetical protein PIB30_054372 [Stylosanthes scabra]|uniref:RRM domain-containing protein n=1 Tax=Stylosanthes scabra TaxID=79078 RepID=A0ABU6RJ44_9FABA|nr:hypothetical protein [Stylosanthes scabra]